MRAERPESIAGCHSSSSREGAGLKSMDTALRPHLENFPKVFNATPDADARRSCRAREGMPRCWRRRLSVRASQRPVTYRVPPRRPRCRCCRSRQRHLCPSGNSRTPAARARNSQRDVRFQGERGYAYPARTLGCQQTGSFFFRRPTILVTDIIIVSDRTIPRHRRHSLQAP